MAERILPDRLLDPDEVDEIRAAMALRRTDQTRFAENEELHRATLNRVMTRKQVPDERIAAALNRLLENAPWPRHRAPSATAAAT